MMHRVVIHHNGYPYFHFSSGMNSKFIPYTPVKNKMGIEMVDTAASHFMSLFRISEV